MAKTVLLTGCSSGVGKATASAFLEDGWTVFATARDPADIEALGEAGCRTLALDVTDDDSIDAAVETVFDAVETLDCLVNNAGYGQFGPIEDVPVEEVQAQFDVNVYGPHRLLRAVLPTLREQESGTIINVSSVAGRVSPPGMGTYSASKFALEAMSDALRSELAPLGVDVALVEPGPVATNFADRADDELAQLERTDDYDTVYTFYEDTSLFGGQSPVAVSPDMVAETILEAGVSPNPNARYPVGPIASTLLKARFLPDSARDWLFTQLLRLL